MTRSNENRAAIYQQCIQFWQALRPNRLLPSLMIGLITGAIGVLFDLSFAALIFADSLSNYLSIGVGLVLFSVASTRVAMALTSSLPGVVADLGTVPTAILAWSVGSIAKDLSGSASPTEILATVLVAIALTSALTGVCLLLLGMLRVGEWVRSIPHSVVGGFVASTGWLLVKGGFRVMTGKPLGILQLPFLLQTDVFIQWLPGLLLAVYLLILSQRRSHPALMSFSLIAAVGLFYIVLFLTGTSVAQASVQGWTMEALASQETWQPLSFFTLFQVRWSAVSDQLVCIVTVVVVTAISLLLNTTGLELVAEQEIDINRELKIAGATNIVLGLSGGILSYQSLSKSVLARKMGATSRTAGLVEASVFIAFPLLATSLVSYVPTSILGGLLLFLGLSLLAEWVYVAWFKLSKSDYLIVQVILFTSATVGFIQGLMTGWLLAIALFVIIYSRLYEVQPGVSGIKRRSSMQRSLHEQQVLDQQGEQLHLLELQGFLFFGTANRLIDRIRDRLSDSTLIPVRFLVLDFAAVREIDSSAIQSLSRILQLAHIHTLTLVFTDLSDTAQAQLQQGLEIKNSVQISSNLDQGLAWCENQIIQAQNRNFRPDTDLTSFTQ